MTRRILFSFWDGGRCHLTRVVTLALEAVRRGIEVGFVSSPKYADELQTLGLGRVFVIPNRPPYPGPPPYPFPLYSHATRHAQRLLGLGFGDTDWLADITTQEVEVIRQFKPSLVVNDYRDTIRTSAQVCGVPVVGITHTTGNPDGYEFGWWVPVPDDLVLPDCRGPFNEVRRSHNLEPISDERYMFGGDWNLIPSCPELDPLARSSVHSTYVGMLSSWDAGGREFRAIPPGLAEQHVYSYVGDPSRPDYGYGQMLGDVMLRRPETGFYVSGDPSSYNHPIIQERIRSGSAVVGSRISGPSCARDSEVVVCHGGNGTVMLALALGKPLICVGPFHTDCTSTFRGVEQAGAGLMLNHSTGPLVRQTAPDLGDGVEILGYWQTELTSKGIGAAIEKVLSDPAYAERAAALGRSLTSLGGAEQAITICERVALSR